MAGKDVQTRFDSKNYSADLRQALFRLTSAGNRPRSG
jgi:hypothetical protein